MTWLHSNLSEKSSVFCGGLFAVACLAGMVPHTARAQQTNSVSALYLGSGAELDFHLYGANGGSGTNGANSDRIADSGAFNYSSSSPGSYIVGFSPGDSNLLTPGTVFTLITFNSTNFTPADASHFTAQAQGGFTAISGTFLLNSVSGGAGSLQFQVDSSAEMPEPNVFALLLVPAVLPAAKVFPGNRSRRSRRSDAGRPGFGFSLFKR